MKKYNFKKTYGTLFLLLIMLITENVISQNNESMTKLSSVREIVFANRNWKEVMAEAKKNGRFIFIDASTSWCGSCKLLKTTTSKMKRC